VVEKGMRFLNSGGFLGPLDQVAELLTAGGQIENKDDDQLFYTRHVLLRDLCIVAFQCCGSGMTLPDPDIFPSRISDPRSQQQRREVEKIIIFLPSFVVINSTKLKIILSLNMYRKVF
jgi:hypothetical protein